MNKRVGTVSSQTKIQYRLVVETNNSPETNNTLTAREREGHITDGQIESHTQSSVRGYAVTRPSPCAWPSTQATVTRLALKAQRTQSAKGRPLHIDFTYSDSDEPAHAHRILGARRRLSGLAAPSELRHTYILRWSEFHRKRALTGREALTASSPARPPCRGPRWRRR